MDYGCSRRTKMIQDEQYNDELELLDALEIGMSFPGDFNQDMESDAD